MSSELLDIIFLLNISHDLRFSRIEENQQVKSGLLIILGSRLNIPAWLVHKLLRFVQTLDQYLFRRETWNAQDINHITKVIKASRNPQTFTGINYCFDSLTLIVVAADKDLELLPLVIQSAKKSLLNFKLDVIRVITPNVSEAFHVLESQNANESIIELIDENEVLPCSEIRSVFATRFPGRENWCLQQFLKFYAVTDCSSKYALVVDADTLLINSQPWILKQNDNEILGLVPTFEFQPQYYEVLKGLKAIKKDPEFSFVPHHMFYETKLVQKIADLLEIQSPMVFATKVDSLSSSTTHAPFCIDYELYAQYVVEHAPTLSQYLKWSNLPVRRTFFLKYLNRPWIIRLLSTFFNSVSLHSWSDSN